MGVGNYHKVIAFFGMLFIVVDLMFFTYIGGGVFIALLVTSIVFIAVGLILKPKVPFESMNPNQTPSSGKTGLSSSVIPPSLVLLYLGLSLLIVCWGASIILSILVRSETIRLNLQTAADAALVINYSFDLGIVLAVIGTILHVIKASSIAPADIDEDEIFLRQTGSEDSIRLTQVSSPAVRKVRTQPPDSQKQYRQTHPRSKDQEPPSAKK